MRFMYLCTWFNIGNASIFTTFLLGTLNTTFICSHMKGQAVMLGTAAWPDVNIPTDPTCFWVGILVSIIHTSLRKPLLYRLAFEGPYQTVARMLEAQQSVRFLSVRLRFFFREKKRKIKPVSFNCFSFHSPYIPLSNDEIFTESFHYCNRANSEAFYLLKSCNILSEIFWLSSLAEFTSLLSLCLSAVYAYHQAREQNWEITALHVHWIKTKDKKIKKWKYSFADEVIDKSTERMTVPHYLAFFVICLKSNYYCLTTFTAFMLVSCKLGKVSPISVSSLTHMD